MTPTTWPPPSLTVVTPVYNAERYIGDTIASVTAQLRPGDQFIVVNDGSIDGTAQILATTDSRVHVIHQPNAGEAAAVNAAIARAHNDIVGVVNGDDLIHPTLLDSVRMAFAADRELAAVYPDWRKIDSDGRTIADIVTYNYDYAVMLAEHMCIPGPGAFFRTAVLQHEPVRDSGAKGLSDYDFWLRFGCHGAKVRRIPQVLASWRLHRQGATIMMQGLPLARAKIAVIENLFGRPDLPADVAVLRRRALSAAYYHAALVGLRASGVPAARFALRSFLLAPLWPATVLSHQKRSLPHLAYAALQPLSGTLHTWISHFLPLRYTRQALLDQVFGFDVHAPR